MMTKTDASFRFHRTVLVVAMCTIFLPAYAQIKVEEKNVIAGVGAVTASKTERSLFGQYNDFGGNRSYIGTLGFDYTLRDEASSRWVDFSGLNLVGETRDLNLVMKNPGNWKLTVDYGELVRHDPHTVNTGLIGAGSTTPQVVHLPDGPGTGSDYELKTKRKRLGVGIAQWITPALQFEADVKTEKKEGARLFGTGMTCPSPVAPGCSGTTGISTGWATLFLPEPINSNHVQVEARLNYAFEKLRVNLGYYGSFYRNENAVLQASVPGSLNNPLGSPLPLSTGLQAILGQPVALPPDNQAHQVDLSGTYSFSGATRASFKLGYSKATQNDSFAGAGFALAPAGVTSLGGEVITTLAKFGITSRPTPKLSLLADWRYENKDDKTPISAYNSLGALTWTNRALPYEKSHAKLLASWQFSSNYRGSIGADYEVIDRGVFTSSSAIFGTSALRQKTEENGVNVELRRKMSESFSGAISASRSHRDGSNWLRPNGLTTGVTEISNPNDPATGFLFTSIFMPTVADRQRDKVKVFADWQPDRKLSFQVSAETGKDSYATPSSYGLQKTDMNQFSVDMGYELSSAWTMNAYASRGSQTLNQSRFSGYVMAFDNRTTSAGIGLSGKPMSKLQVGASLSFIDDRSAFSQSLDTFAGADSVALLAVTGGLPDIVFRQTGLKLFGKYVLDKRSSVRVDLVHQRSSFDDWAWAYNSVPFVYQDNTTVSMKPRQSVSFLGIVFNYTFD